MKRILSLLVILLLICCLCLSAAASDAGGDPTQETAGTAASSGESSAGLEIAAKSALLMDVHTGKVLYEKNPHDAMPPASITKIMTMLLVMEDLEAGTLHMEDMVTASAHAASMGGTQIWLAENEQMSVHDLLKATAIASANDAAMALAEHVSGSEEAFVARMNEKAKELGMNDTVFVNPTGLDADGHVSSAYDIALMSRELLRHPAITEFTSVWMDTLRDGKTELVNTNKLVRFYKGCTGLKTGTTDGAGSCVSVSATRGDMSLISVVMGCQTTTERFSSARALLDHGFSSYVMFDTSLAGAELTSVKVNGGESPEVPVQLSGNDGSIILRKGQETSVTVETELLPSVDAPVQAGQVLGEVRICDKDAQIASFPVVAAEDVERLTVFKAFVRLFTRLVTMGTQKVVFPI